MAGAIPSLNRGGSWRQDDVHSANRSTTSHGYAATASIFPRPSQIVPQLNPSMAGNRSNAHFAQHPWAVHGPFAAPRPRPPTLTMPPKSSIPAAVAQSSVGGGSTVSGKAASVGPTKHPGWAKLHAGGYRSSPTSPTGTSGASFIASQVKSQYGVKTPPPQSQSRTTPLVSPRFPEPTWEYASGSPKPMTAEPDYFALPVSPGMVSAPQTPAAAHQDSLPPPPKPAPQSPRPRIESSHKAPRPALSRRHTHDRFSPEMAPAIERAGAAGSKIDSKSLGRVRARSGLRKPTFDIGSEAGESYYAPSSKTCAHSVDPPSSAVSAGVSSGGHSRSRPTASGRSTTTGSTLSTINGNDSSNLSAASRSFAERRFKNRSHPALSTIASTVDFTQTAPSTPTAREARDRSRPAMSQSASTIDFTRTAPTTPTQKSPRSNHPSMDVRSLRDALPDVDPSLPSAPMTAPAVGGGYVGPTSDEGYDRYTAHPAAPVPPRVDVSAEKLAEAAKPPTGAGLKHVTRDTYRPPGLPKPLKEIGWNRDGPAMRTHGIAWLREGTAEALPGRPAGPRWIQARPPASALSSGVSWWESAG